MAFDDSKRDSGHWASRQDCCDVLATVPGHVENDEDILNRAIMMSTDYVQLKLRTRWPSDWPASFPSEAIVRAVAVLAVFSVFFRRALPDELQWLQDEADKWERFLDALADSKATPDPEDESITRVDVAVTRPPDWSRAKWGFGHAAGKVE